MNGFTGKSVACACLACLPPLLLSVGGCYTYRQKVDPCWPERYNAVARHSVNDIFDAQALNGHIKDQTIWNYHFKTEDRDDPESRLKLKLPTAELSYAGQMHLQYLVRRLPTPDYKLYMQTARDLPVATPIKDMVDMTNDLNARRIKAIYEYLAVLTSGYQRYPVAFDVAIHDLQEPTMPALPISGAQRPNPVGAVPDLWNQFMGSIPANQLSGAMGGGGGGGGVP